jgi:hypothetical protein
MHLRRPLVSLVAVVVIATACSGPARHRDAARGTTTTTKPAPGLVAPARVPSLPAPDLTQCRTGEDQTQQLQSLIDRSPDGTSAAPDVIHLPAGTCYVVDRSVVLADRRYLTIAGDPSDPAVFLRQGAGDCAVQSKCYIFFLQGGTGISFTNVAVVSNNVHHVYVPSNQDSSAWWIWGTQGVTLTRDSVSNVWGDFVTVGPDTYRTWRWSSDVVVSGDRLNGSGRQGIAITSGQNVTISDDLIANAALSAIDIEPDSGTGPLRHGVPTYGGADHIDISGNVVGHAGTLFLSDYGHCAVVANVSVTANRLVGEPFVVWVKGCPRALRSGWSITGNSSDTPFASPRAAIELSYVSGAKVTDNQVPLSAREHMSAVKLAHCTGVTITGNHFPGAAHLVRPLGGQPMGSGLVISGDSVGNT